MKCFRQLSPKAVRVNCRLRFLCSARTHDQFHDEPFAAYRQVLDNNFDKTAENFRLNHIYWGLREFSGHIRLISHNERLVQFMPVLEFFRQQPLQLQDLSLRQVLTVMNCRTKL
jgi:hypothetical protein